MLNHTHTLKFTNLPLNILTHLFKFLDKKDFFITILNLSTFMHDTMIHKKNMAVIFGPFFAANYEISDLFLKTQSQLHAPLGILGRHPKLIRQFLLTDKRQVFERYTPLPAYIGTSPDTYQTRFINLKLKLRISISNPNFNPTGTRLKEDVTRRYWYLYLMSPIKWFGRNLDKYASYHGIEGNDHIAPLFQEKYKANWDGVSRIELNNWAGLSLFFFTNMFFLFLVPNIVFCKNMFMLSLNLDLCETANKIPIFYSLTILVGFVASIAAGLVEIKVKAMIDEVVQKRHAEDLSKANKLLKMFRKYPWPEEKDISGSFASLRQIGFYTCPKKEDSERRSSTAAPKSPT